MIFKRPQRALNASLWWSRLLLQVLEGWQQASLRVTRRQTIERRRDQAGVQALWQVLLRPNDCGRQFKSYDRMNVA